MQQAVTLRNTSYLSDQRYKHEMRKQFCGEWTLQADQRVHMYCRLDILLLSLGLLGLMLCAVVDWRSTGELLPTSQLLILVLFGQRSVDEANLLNRPRRPF